MPGPQDLIAQLMAAQQQGSQGMPMPPPGGMPTGPAPMSPSGPAQSPPGMPPGMPMPPPPPSGPPPPGAVPSSMPPDMPVGASDEEMLSQVSDQMGGGAPPPTGGMKWVSLEEDQQALMNDPSPENIQAFIDYWGEEKLPPGIKGGESEPDPSDKAESGENE